MNIEKARGPKNSVRGPHAARGPVVWRHWNRQCHWWPTRMLKMYMNEESALTFKDEWCFWIKSNIEK